MEKVYKRYRYFLLILLSVSIILFGVMLWRYVEYEIPDEVRVTATEDLAWENVFEQPFVTYELYAETAQNTKSPNKKYQIDCYLFGIFPLKTVEVQMTDQAHVYASGSAVGIYMDTEGVHVIDSGELVNEDGITCSPAKHIIQSGDYICKVDGKAIENKKELLKLVEKSSGEEMRLEVLRDGERIELMLSPILTEDGTYKLGIWVRDNVQGIGTMTYIEEDGSFGALGHGIRDSDTGVTLNISGGSLYTADIVSVKKGVEGAPGELQGVINYGKLNRIGRIYTNAENGIRGQLNNGVSGELAKQYYPVGFKQEIERGKATILCGQGKDVQEYEIEITDITLNSKDYKKELKIKVTDERLIKKTGGIVQGMSGSPILQNGKIVGAVTHVLVNAPTRGYGIFIEDMMEK